MNYVWFTSQALLDYFRLTTSKTNLISSSFLGSKEIETQNLNEGLLAMGGYASIDNSMTATRVVVQFSLSKFRLSTTGELKHAFTLFIVIQT